MFLTPDAAGIIIPLRITRFVRGFPRRETIWAKTPKIDPARLASQLVHDSSGMLPSDHLLALCEHSHVERPRLNPELNYYLVNRKLDTMQLRTSTASHAEVALRLVPHSWSPMLECDSRRRMLVTQPPVADVVIGRSDTRWGLFEVHNVSGVTIGDILDVEERAYSQVRGPNTTRFIGSGWG
jgi:hypothetical protein